MTSTSVVLGIATLGTPEAAPDCDRAMDPTGSIATRKGIVNFICQPLDSIWHHCLKEYDRTLSKAKKIYSSAKHFIKKFLACINICSRLWGDKVIRTVVSTPAILGNNS